jgi:hypothetical protein
MNWLPLGAVDDVVIAIANRSCLHSRRIAAGVRLGLRETDSFFAADHRHEKTLFLFFVAVKQHRPHFRPEDRCVPKRDRHGTRDLFHDHATAHQIETGAAVLLRHVEQPEADRSGFFLERFDVLLRHVLAFGRHSRSSGISSRSTNLRTVPFKTCNSSGRLKSTFTPFWILDCGFWIGGKSPTQKSEPDLELLTLGR